MALIPQDSTANVTTSAADIFNEVTGVVERVVTNTSSAGQTIYIAVGQDAVVGKGIVLPPGAVYAQVIDARYTPDVLRWSAIASAVSATVAIHQRVVE